jgi:FkbM family methyltransferase
MNPRSVFDSLRRGLRRPEVRHHPVQALGRRIAWRRYWKDPSRAPIILNDWWRGMRIALPQAGTAVLVYYRRHSDILVVETLESVLRPGMTVLDIGASIGEYTLVAAKLVTPQGRVHAVEPLSTCAEAIRQNAGLNSLEHVSVHELAISDRSGRIGFVSDSGRTFGWIANDGAAPAFQAEVRSLDDFVKEQGIGQVDFIKLDAGGNELSVLRGGTNTLSAQSAPVILLKLYNPQVVHDRFGYEATDIVATLLDLHYNLSLVERGGGIHQFPVRAFSSVTLTVLHTAASFWLPNSYDTDSLFLRISYDRLAGSASPVPAGTSDTRRS